LFIWLLFTSSRDACLFVSNLGCAFLALAPFLVFKVVYVLICVVCVLVFNLGYVFVFLRLLWSLFLSSL